MFELKNINSKVFVSILSLTLILLTFIFIIFLNNNDVNEKPITIITLENCEIQKEICRFNVQGISLEISMDQDIYYLKPFNVSLKRVLTSKPENNSSDIESVFIDFKMKNMNMGINRFQLKKVKSKSDDIAWEGVALLPVCVAGRADWVSELDILTIDSHYRFIFPIIVKQANR